jgi:hypothetical protein
MNADQLPSMERLKGSAWAAVPQTGRDPFEHGSSIDRSPNIKGGQL